MIIMRKKILILLGLFSFVECKCPFVRVIELGDNFALVQVDDTNILYDRNGNKECFFSSESTIVVPAEVVAYNSDERWIITKSHSTLPNTDFYYIIDKEYDFTRLGYVEELKRQSIGPLDSIQFQKEKFKYGIKLELKSSNK